jgi:hypothetical protein
MEEEKSASWWKKKHGRKENLKTEAEVGKHAAKETPPPANLTNFIVTVESSSLLVIVADCTPPACPEIWHRF